MNQYQSESNTNGNNPGITSSDSQPAISSPLQELGEEFFRPGVSRPKSRKNTRHTLEQCQYFVQWIGLGTKSISGVNANKRSPEQASVMMKLMGTVEGEQKYPTIPWMKANPDGIPTFKRKHQLCPFSLRQYVSKSIKDLEKQVQKALASPTRTLEVEEDDDD